MNICIFVFVAFLQFSTFRPSVGDMVCGAETGPSGGLHCISLFGYTGKQWGTCLTNEYIVQKSRGKHQCVDQQRKYCYYQCMMESYEREHGTVTGECRCIASNSSDVKTSLPAWCYSPSGANCDWYSQCLEKKYPCENTAEGYAVKYAEKFCNLYTKNYGGFSKKGQQWINAVRKCLQVKLVPKIRQYVPPSCAEIKKFAFESHNSCYLNPFPGSPSICDLPCGDIGMVIWTVYSSLFSAEAVPALKGMFTVTSQCTFFAVSCRKQYELVLQTIVIFKVLRMVTRFGRDIKEVPNYDNIAKDYTNALAKKLNFDRKTMGWYGYAENATEVDKGIRMTVVVHLADKTKLDLNYIGERVQVNLNDSVSAIVDHVQKGLRLDVPGYTADTNEIRVCDGACANGYKIFRPSNTSSVGRSISRSAGIFHFSFITLLSTLSVKTSSGLCFVG